MKRSRRWLTTICALAAACTASAALAASPLTEEWSATFGGTGTDALTSFRPTADGGYLLLGDTSSAGAGSTDIWLVKIDGTGHEQWQRTFGGGAADNAAALEQTVDGGAVILGRTSSYGAGYQDLWLIKTDADGNKEWDKTFGGAFYDYPGVSNPLLQTLDGGYLLLGRTNSLGAGNYDSWLIKLDADGNVEWDRTFGGAFAEEAFTVEQTADGGFVLAGTTTPRGIDKDLWLVKVDADGNELWSQTYGGWNTETISAFRQTADGGYMLLGTTKSFGAGSYDIWLIKTDADGNVEWDQTFGGTNSDEARSVEQTADGGYVVLGDTPTLGAGSYDLWLIKTDSRGRKEWDKTYGGANVEWPRDLEPTADGGCLLLGLTRSVGAGDFDLWLIKTDADGNAEWDQTFGGWRFEDAFSMGGADGGYLLLGQTFSAGSGSGDAWLIKLKGGDSTPPSTALALEGTAGDAGWYVSSVAAILTATDEGAGVAATYYSLDGGHYVEGTTVDMTTDGRHTLNYYSVDAFGNTEEVKSVVVDIDRTAPEITIGSPLAGGYGNDDILLVEAVAADTLSGSADIAFALDGQPYDPAVPLDLAACALGLHELSVAAADQAGNAATAAVRFSVFATREGTAQLIGGLLATGEIVSRGAANNLISSMGSILDSLQAGQLNQADNKINALSNYLNAQDGKQLSAEAAALLRDYLGQIRAAL